MPAIAGTPRRRRSADASGSAEVGREGSAPRRRIRTMFRARANRMRFERVRATGVDPGGRQSGEPVVARAGGTLSLSRMPRAVRRESALLGAESRAGTGLSALVLARLEDAAERRLDRLERLS